MSYYDDLFCFSSILYSLEDAPVLQARMGKLGVLILV